MRSILLLALAAAGASAAEPRFPAPPTAEAWSGLPRGTANLPVWARTLAPSLPLTAHALVELDDLHRANSPIGNALRAKLRWVASDAIGCGYGKAYAEHDANRAGVSKEQLVAWAKSDDQLVPFARKMALAADSVTDTEFAEILKEHGPETVVGIVHTLAYAGYQDRLLLALGCATEPDGVVPPLGLNFEAKEIANAVPPLRKPLARRVRVPANSVESLDWSDLAGKHLPTEMNNQRKRKLRVPRPPKSSLDFLPESGRERAASLVWSEVSLGYQPKLTSAWFAAASMFQAESKMDPFFPHTLFWIVTRANRCFY